MPGFERQYLFYDLRYARALDEILAQLPKGRDLDPLYDWMSNSSVPVAGKQDQRDVSGRFFSIVPEDNGATTQTEAILAGTADSTAKLTAVAARADALHASLPPPQAVFFNDNLRVQARFMLDLNRVLHQVAQAMKALPDRRGAAGALRAAERAASAMCAGLREAEHDRFLGWYEEERVFQLDQLQEKIRLAIAQVDGHQ